MGLVDEVAYVTYSHSSCEDIWEAYVGELNKYSPKMASYACLDKDTNVFSNVHIYDDEAPYYLQMLGCLKMVKEDFIIPMLEDFILYDHVQQDKMNTALKFLEDNPEYSYVRLIKSGVRSAEVLKGEIYEVPLDAPYPYSMQPSIWRKKDFIKLYKRSKVEFIRQEQGHHEAYRKLKMKGGYFYDNEERRKSSNHYNSSVFPFIATAVIKGKWNMGEYKEELSPIFEEYGIDPSERGTS